MESDNKDLQDELNNERLKNNNLLSQNSQLQKENTNLKNKIKSFEKLIMI